jgi:hypothetical protein
MTDKKTEELPITMTMEEETYQPIPIERVVKRYQQLVKESNKEYDKHKDSQKLKDMTNIQKEALGWVLGKN